jgi:hypothetical protein
LLQALVVVGAGGAIGYFGWETLARPTREIRTVVTDSVSVDPARVDPSQCATGNSLEAIACNARAVGWALLGVVVLALALFMFRAPLMAVIRAGIRHLPRVAAPVLTALLATAAFTMAYANIHANPGLEADGLLPVEAFPALVGLMTFLVTTLAASSGGFSRVLFGRRDRIPVALRFVMVLAVPLLAGRLILQDLDGLSPIGQEQAAILVSALVGALATIPSAAAQRVAP